TCTWATGSTPRRRATWPRFRGKILRMNLDGTPAAGNPFYDPSDGIDAHDYGFRNPFSGSWRAADGFHYEVENGPNVDRFARIVPDYGWTGYDADMYINALYNWAPAIA